MQSGLRSFSYAYMHRMLDRSKAEIEVSLVGARNDLANAQVLEYNRLHAV